jgi:uncharacterized protein (DUF4415 family)
MMREQRLTRKKSSLRGRSAGSRASTRRSRSSGARKAAGRGKRQSFSLQTMKISDFYRPLKKPVTLRLDADVLAWFKKDGRRYQTRINFALRKIMEREMKENR